MKSNKVFFLTGLFFLGSGMSLSGMENEPKRKEFNKKIDVIIAQAKENVSITLERSMEIFNLLEQFGTKVTNNCYRHEVPMKGIFGFNWQKFVLTATKTQYKTKRGLVGYNYDVKRESVYYPQTKLLFLLGLVAIPASVYIYAKNYTWVNSQLLNMIKMK